MNFRLTTLIGCVTENGTRFLHIFTNFSVPCDITKIEICLFSNFFVCLSSRDCTRSGDEKLLIEKYLAMFKKHIIPGDILMTGKLVAVEIHSWKLHILSSVLFKPSIRVNSEAFVASRTQGFHSFSFNNEL